jgi:hypothetical protein
MSIDERNAARDEWRAAREMKRSRKAALTAEGKDAAALRRDRVYREYRKRQRRAAVRIRHLERRMNRKRAREEEG